MKLSAPIYQLKRNARLLAREKSIPLHDALDRIAVAEGFNGWSLLAARHEALSPAARLYSRLEGGDMVLVGARPRQGKTLLAMELATEAVKAGNRAVFFTLEYTEADIIKRLRAMGFEPTKFGELFAYDCSDGISSEHIIASMRQAGPGTLIVVDYLQLLDQKRGNPSLAAQVTALKSFAAERRVVIVFIAQIDRSYDPDEKPYPDLGDVRLPNPVDLSLFSKTCFLNNGEFRLQAMA